MIISGETLRGIPVFVVISRKGSGGFTKYENIYTSPVGDRYAVGLV